MKGWLQKNKIIEADDTHILVLKQLHLTREQLEIASSPRQGFARLYRDPLQLPAFRQRSLKASFDFRMEEVGLKAYKRWTYAF